MGERRGEGSGGEERRREKRVGEGRKGEREETRRRANEESVEGPEG